MKPFKNVFDERLEKMEFSCANADMPFGLETEIRWAIEILRTQQKTIKNQKEVIVALEDELFHNHPSKHF